MIIEQPTLWLRWLYPKAVWRMDKHEHSVYLTFDDGPIPESTPFILDTLREFGIKATFFMVGENVSKYPYLYQQIIDEGHQVGNHSFNHISGFRHSHDEYRRNVEKANELIHSRFFRPPHGWLRWPQYHWMRKHYDIIMWDVVTRDYSRLLTADDVVDNVRRYTRNGSIITFHDSLKSIEKLKTALPASIKWLMEQGYEFKKF